MSITSPKPTHIKYEKLIADIANGEIQIPKFQRDFVWELKRSAKLLDSILKGYPIGTFIFWQTRKRLQSLKKLGNDVLESPGEGKFVYYVLDGQQRLTSLYAARKGLKIDRPSRRKPDDFESIYIDLNADESKDEDIVTFTADVKKLPGKTFITLKELLASTTDFTTTYDSFPNELKAKILGYRQRFENYLFSAIEIEIEEDDRTDMATETGIATEIFTRINVGGKGLTVFEIMVAQTYDEERDFDLFKKYKDMIGELRRIDYIIPEEVMLQLIALILKGNCQGKTILTLDKNTFIDTWPAAVNSVKCAIDYFRENMGVPTSQLLPYPALLAPFAYLFYRSPKGPTSEKQREELENLFWQCSLGERYSEGTEGKLAQDIKRIEQILDNQTPTYDWKIDTSTEHLIRNGSFKIGKSFIKAILCIVASKHPKSFKENKEVAIKGDSLKRSNSKNYHHFFPKKFLENEKGENYPLANNIVNITILDEGTNKEIGAKPPSQYMEEFKKENKKISETMKTHLIENLTEFGVWDDNYDTFMQKRAEAICEEIRKRIIDR